MSISSSLKRNFIPSNSSTFNPAKKFKLSFQTQSDPLSSSFNTSSSVPSSNFTPTVPQPFYLHTEHRSRKHSTAPTEDLQMEIIQFRPKFKARPMPKYPTKDIQCLNSNTHLSQKRNSSVSSETQCRRGQMQNSFKNSIQRSEFNQNLQDHPDIETILRTRSCNFSENSELNSTFSPRPAATKAEFKFIAKPMPSFSSVFVPVTNFTPTQPLAFEFSTEKRAVEREKFNNLLKDKENQINELKQEEARLEAECIKSYRQTLNFKAKPLQILQPFLVKRSDEPLTRPKSPTLHTKMRFYQKEMNEDSMDLD